MSKSWARLEDLSLLMTRETVRDTPQYHIMRLSGNGTGPQLRRLSDYPHPYPSLRDLQKEVIRCGLFLAWMLGGRHPYFG